MTEFNQLLEALTARQEHLQVLTQVSIPEHSNDKCELEQLIGRIKEISWVITVVKNFSYLDKITITSDEEFSRRLRKFAERFAAAQIQLPPEFLTVLNDNFDKLIEDSNEPKNNPE
jgi:oligoendopeptidase F